MTDPRTVKLNQLGMNIGEEISMCYDYGCNQMFTIKLESVTDIILLKPEPTKWII